MKHLAFAITLLTLPFWACAQSIGTADLQCLEIDPASGLVDIDWGTPTDPAGEFQYYEIFASVNGGSFLDVTSSLLAYNQSEFTFSSPAALSNQVCFFVRSYGLTAAGLPFFSENSDTLCTISLDYELVDALNGLVQLNWTYPFQHNMNAPANLEYTLLQEHPAGVWTSLGNFPADSLSFVYAVPFCNPTPLSFQVVMADPLGCIHQSDIETGVFNDDVDPETPTVVSVSYDDNNNFVVQWNENPSPDTYLYQVYAFTNAQVPVANVNGIANTTFVYDFPGTIVEPQPGFTVAAFDQCVSASDPLGNASPTQGYSYAVRLNPLPYAECSNQVALSWSAYVGWDEGVDKYYIWRSIDGGAYVLIDSVGGSILNYTDINVLPGLVHGYYISALANATGYTARSNKNTVLVTAPLPPAYVFIREASVTGESEISVTVSTTATNREMDYILQRRRRFDPNQWEELDVIKNTTLTELIFLDNDVLTNTFSYTYRVVLRNSCGIYIDTTEIASTILLQGVADNSNFNNLLQWNGYSIWPQGISEYTLFRSQGQNGAPEIVHQAPSTFFFKDDISELWQQPGNYCYWIEAQGNPYPLTGEVPVSLSNKVCLVIEPGIWIPNAFIMDSRVAARQTFGPVLSFTEVRNYRMIVYSRWGDMVFDTTDYTQFWDGKSDRGKVVEQGLYTYFISIEDGTGTLYERRGKVLFMVGPEPID